MMRTHWSYRRPGQLAELADGRSCTEDRASGAPGRGAVRGRHPRTRRSCCTKSSPVKQLEMIPFYAPDGSSMGFRKLGAAERRIAGGPVKPASGRKGRLKAIFLRRLDEKDEDGTPVETQGPWFPPGASRRRLSRLHAAGSGSASFQGDAVHDELTPEPVPSREPGNGNR